MIENIISILIYRLVHSINDLHLLLFRIFKAGYQITQYRNPLAVNGSLEFQVFAGGKNSYKGQVDIKQIQLEQDSGRSLHAGDSSLIDLNRAGIPLMEIVFEPQLKSSEEATALIKELCLILKSLNTCTCKMEGWFKFAVVNNFLLLEL